MHIYLKRYAFGDDTTLGLLFINNEFECYTLEDEEREKKIKGRTAIPRGFYEVKLRKKGGFHNRYKSRYDFHKGMLHVQNVPDFKYILFHTGNNDDHTEGCILVGEAIDGYNIPPGKTVGAYKRFYQKVVNAIEDGERILLHIDKLRT